MSSVSAVDTILKAQSSHHRAMAEEGRLSVGSLEHLGWLWDSQRAFSSAPSLFYSCGSCPAAVPASPALHVSGGVAVSSDPSVSKFWSVGVPLAWPFCPKGHPGFRT